MQEDSDPYYKWLGIPRSEQPPNHYRLLGISLFESDREVIRNAADRCMSYVKTFSGGPHSNHSEKVLNEVSMARVCLLKPEEKRVYDDQLRSRYDVPVEETTQTSSSPVSQQRSRSDSELAEVWLATLEADADSSDHYRLLGLFVFESNLEVIRNAADRCMSYLHTLSGGPHADVSERLQNAVTAAKVCLLSEERKRAYDAELRRSMWKDKAPIIERKSIQEEYAGGDSNGSFTINTESKRPRVRRPRKSPIALLVVMCVLTALAIVLLIVQTR